MPNPAVSLVIPNWNGRDFLGRCLASAVASARTWGGAWELLLVDDASSDGSADDAERDFPGAVTVVRNPVNVGFGATVERGVAEARGALVVLLNNDLVSEPGLVAGLVEPMLSDRTLFGVTGKVMEWDGAAPNHLRMGARWDPADGLLRLTYSDPPAATPAMFLLGGCCAFRRKAYLELGGLCPLFAPGYWEDYDLSWRALKAGHRLLYAPDARGYHFGQGSMTRAHAPARLSAVRARNAVLFHWLNLTDDTLLRAHTAALPRLLARSLAASGRDGAAGSEGRAAAKGLAMAFAMLGRVAAERRRRAPTIRRTDSGILAELDLPEARSSDGGLP